MGREVSFSVNGEFLKRKVVCLGFELRVMYDGWYTVQEDGGCYKSRVDARVVTYADGNSRWAGMGEVDEMRIMGMRPVMVSWRDTVGEPLMAEEDDVAMKMRRVASVITSIITITNY